MLLGDAKSMGVPGVMALAGAGGLPLGCLPTKNIIKKRGKQHKLALFFLGREINRRRV